MLNIDNNTNIDYATGYVDSLGDVLDMLQDLSYKDGESAELYKLKERLREYISNAEDVLNEM